MTLHRDGCVTALPDTTSAPNRRPSTSCSRSLKNQLATLTKATMLAAEEAILVNLGMPKQASRVGELSILSAIFPSI